MTDLLQWWNKAAPVLRADAGLPDDTQLPTPAAVADAIWQAQEASRWQGEPLPAWIPDAVENYRQRLCDLVEDARPLYVAIGPGPSAGFRTGYDGLEWPDGYHILKTDGRTAQRTAGTPAMHPDPTPAQTDAQGETGPDGENGEGAGEIRAASVHPASLTTARLQVIDGRMTRGFAMLNTYLMGIEMRSADGDTDVTGQFVAGFEAVHWVWQQTNGSLRHPLAALIEGWLQRPIPFETDPHRNGIMPSGLLPRPPSNRTLPAQLALLADDQLPALGRVERETGQLPLFAELMAEHDLPVTPLLLANAAGFRSLQPGRGARLDKRLLVFGLLSMPRGNRRPGGSYEWRPTLREIRDLLWPAKSGGKSSFRPGKHGAGLLSALQAINLAEIMLPDGDIWRPMRVWRNPTRSLDSETIIEIRLPDGSDHGPLVDKGALVDAGTVSDPAFDLQLGLAYLWDEAKARNGGYRIHATRPEVLRDGNGYITDAAGKVILERGQPVRRWNHPLAVRTGRQERHPQADKVRVLTREERRRLAYGRKRPADSGNYTRECNAADRLLVNMEADGRIVIERQGSSWRILEAWDGE